MAALLCGLLILIVSLPRENRSFLMASLGFVGLWFPAAWRACAVRPPFVRRVDSLLGLSWQYSQAPCGALQFEDETIVRALEVGVVSAVSLILASPSFFPRWASGSAGVHDRYPDWQVVQALNGDGVRAGDRVSYIGDALSDHVWAYLAHVTIAAEIPSDDISTFWAATDLATSGRSKMASHTGCKSCGEPRWFPLLLTRLDGRELEIRATPSGDSRHRLQI